MTDRFVLGEIVLVGKIRPYKAKFLGRQSRYRYLVEMLEGPDIGREVNVECGSVRRYK